MSEKIFSKKGYRPQTSKKFMAGERGVPESCMTCRRVPKSTCNKLHKKIDDLVNGKKTANSGTRGLEQRWSDQAGGKMAPGTKGWNNHEEEYLKQRNQLRDLLAMYKAQRCKNRYKGRTKSRKAETIRSAEHWARKAPPTAGQWTGRSSGWLGRMFRGRGGGGCGGGCGGGGALGTNPKLNRLFPPQPVL